jgi:hypothetical protein
MPTSEDLSSTQQRKRKPPKRFTEDSTQLNTTKKKKALAVSAPMPTPTPMPLLTRTQSSVSTSSISTSTLTHTATQPSISTNKRTSSRPQPSNEDMVSASPPQPCAPEDASDSNDEESDKELIVVSEGGDTEEDVGQVRDNDDEVGECNLKF